jgi:hypothetical protein
MARRTNPACEFLRSKTRECAVRSSPMIKTACILVLEILQPLRLVRSRPAVPPLPAVLGLIGTQSSAPPQAPSTVQSWRPATRRKGLSRLHHSIQGRTGVFVCAESVAAHLLPGYRPDALGHRVRDYAASVAHLEGFASAAACLWANAVSSIRQSNRTVPD